MGNTEWWVKCRCPVFTIHLPGGLAWLKFQRTHSAHPVLITESRPCPGFWRACSWWNVNEVAQGPGLLTRQITLGVNALTHSFRWTDRMKDAKNKRLHFLIFYTIHTLIFQDSFKNFHSKKCGTFPAEDWVCHPNSGNHLAPCLSSEAVFCYLIDLKIQSVIRISWPHPPNVIQFFWGKCRWSHLPCPCNRK